MIIGHLTDLHLNGSGSRHQKFEVALKRARQLGAAHIVLTGDLSASGKAEEFSELAWALRHQGDSEVTIIPGNHDEGRSFDLALAGGSLGRFEKTSRHPVQIGGATIFPIDTRFKRRALLFRALGKVGQINLPISKLMASSTQTTILAMHHGPQDHPMQMFDGLVGRERLNSLLENLPNLHVVCGHDHRILDIGKVHVAASVAHHGDPLRLYEASSTTFNPIYQSKIEGNYFTLGKLRNADRER